MLPPHLPEAPKRRCLCYLKGLCPCSRDAVYRKLWQTNVYDTVDTLGEVMKLCDINVLKVYRALPALANCFFNYKEGIIRIDGPRRKYFDRVDLIHELGFQAAMNRIEAQLAYSIVKRAFRAFYFVTDAYGLPAEEQRALMKHRSECHWVHAAQTTAHIHSYLEGFAIAEEQIFTKKIECVYKKLYDRMMHRYKQLKQERVQKICQENEKSFNKRKYKIASIYSLDETIERCKCPKLKCECSGDLFERMSEPLYSQGPYECFWTLELEDVVKPDLMQAEKICTSTLESEEVICDSECLCTCTECECSCEDVCSDTEVYEEEFTVAEDDPCANLRKLLGEPEYLKKQHTADRALIEDISNDQMHENLQENMLNDKSDIVEDKKKPQISKRGFRHPRNKPKRLTKRKHKPLPCCAKCVPRKLKNQKTFGTCILCICSSDEVVGFPDDDRYRT